jgi:glycosyltransferase involved in cell wall biosynthesis
MTRGPKTILVVVPDFRIGGMERLLARLLNGFDPTKLKMLFVSLGPKGAMEEQLPADVPVTRFLRRHRYDILPAREIAAMIEKENVETIFTLGIFAFFYAKLATWRARRPVKIFMSYHLTKSRSPREHVELLAYARFVGNKDTIISVCHNQVTYLHRTLFIPRKRFHTIYNGIDTTYWTPPPGEFDRGAFRSRWAIPADAYVLVHVAQLRREKRQQDALKALERVHRTSPLRPYLMFIGDGDGQTRTMLKELVGRLDIDSYVRFCGQQKDVRPFYWSADVSILTSVSETFSMAVLEAMATGLPCVVTDVGGAREIIVDGVNGQCVPPRNPAAMARAWIALREDAGKYQAVTIRTKVQEKFSFSECLAAYQSLLLES